MKKSIFLSLFFLIVLSLSLHAQVAINATGVAPASTAMLDVNSTNKGMLIPRMSSNSGISGTPATGLLIYNTTTKSINYYDGTVWKELSDDAGFEINGSLIRPKTGHYFDDFIVGSDVLPNYSSVTTKYAMFYDYSKRAFRAGSVNSSNAWSPANIGTSSTAFGNNCFSKGTYSLSSGDNVHANGNGSTAFGTSTYADGNYSFAAGSQLYAPAFSEAAFGTYNTDYTAGAGPEDRLFSVGMGSYNARKNAMAIFTNGQLSIGSDANQHFARLFVNADSGEDAFLVRINDTTRMLIKHNGSIANYLTNGSTARPYPSFALNLRNSNVDLKGRGRAYSWNTYSDRRIKSEIIALGYGLKEIMNLSPKSYRHHDSEYPEDGNIIFKGLTTSKDIGLIAQEVYEIIPEAVSKPTDEERDLWTMDYTRLIPVLIKSIQEQQEILDIKNTRIKSLEILIKDLASRVELLESKK